MRRLLPFFVLAIALCVPAAPAVAQDGLTTNARYKEGPSSRYMIEGNWGFSRAKAGPYLPVQVPHAWNAGDNSDASYRGGVGFYRKDFHLPGSRSATWIVRFESVNYHARIYLNGKEIARHDGAYQPFEVELPRKGLKRGLNRLEVRVDSRRQADDFPPFGISAVGNATGGWWNYGGILREVYLRKVNRVDLQNVVVRPAVKCATCKATVTYEATVKNYSAKSLKVDVRSRLGAQSVALGTRTIKPKGTVTVTRRITVAKPKLWSPAKPTLYNTAFTLRAGGRTVQTYRLRSGLRSITVKGGRLKLNGQNLNIRGYGMHEDSPTKGFAIGNDVRENQIQLARNSGALMLRAHYPLHPYYYERADELGMLIWGEVPVYSVKTKELAKVSVRRRAVAEVQTLVREKQNHPSLIIYSIGNELNSSVGPYVGAYIREATAAARKIDPSRPVALAINGYPGAGCREEYGPLQVIGLNEYFGWYVGPDGQIADQSLLSEYLDQMRQCYPGKAMFVTEFGAEANRNGPPEEKGSYQFQQDFISYHLNVFNSKPWLSGALYWALQEFRVRPNWEGGNPRPNPPLHEKGVIDFNGNPKPGYYTLSNLFKATKQVGAP
ncbi:MAG TPA: glycoside hydrolase family 2 TIM barrel-domain containing protein [Baekduia sp.]|nr:glycoside hydrolase family 2 TIM barrel-domain containing protein [Baekduia sp.]